MQTRRFEVLTWRHVAIYGVVTALFWVMAFLAARAGPGDLPDGLPLFAARAIPAAGAILATLIVWALWLVRFRYARSIAWYTWGGVAVHPGEARDWLAERRIELDQQIEKVLRWWSAAFPRHAAAFADRLNGYHLEAVVSEKQIRDHMSDVDGWGIHSGNKARVVWRPQTDGEDFFAILQHELCHLFLDAMGKRFADHHALMRDWGIPWR